MIVLRELDIGGERAFLAFERVLLNLVADVIVRPVDHKLFFAI